MQLVEALAALTEERKMRENAEAAAAEERKQREDERKMREEAEAAAAEERNQREIERKMREEAEAAAARGRFEASEEALRTLAGTSKNQLVTARYLLQIPAQPLRRRPVSASDKRKSTTVSSTAAKLQYPVKRWCSFQEDAVAHVVGMDDTQRVFNHSALGVTRSRAWRPTKTPRAAR